MPKYDTTRIEHIDSADRSGDGDQLATTNTGAKTTGNLASWDASDDLADSGVSAADIGGVTVAKEGSEVGTRGRINLIEGTNVTLTVTDDAGNDEIDVTITASGGGSGLTRGSVVDLTNGGANDQTSVTIISGLSSPDRIEIAMSDVSLSGTDNFQIQIGDSGGIETAGYESVSFHSHATGTSGHSDTAGFAMRGGLAQFTTSARLFLTRVDGNTWQYSGLYQNLSTSGSPTGHWLGTAAGVKTLSDTLTQILIKSAGSNTFDGGSVVVKYS